MLFVEENLIKSTNRVKDHGEVFTPKKIVKFMIDQPEIKAKANDLQATFLEPSAGEGAFLTELLVRKLETALRQSHDARSFGENCLIGLSSLYGIELLEDNVEVLVMNMNDAFRDFYRNKVRTQFGKNPSTKVLNSAKVIIRANMAQGDALKRITSDGKPIIFSEWTPVDNIKSGHVQRTEYTFNAIVEGTGPTGNVRGATEQLELFSLDEGPQDTKSVQYAICKWSDIYLEKVISLG